jgi:hypothetical protein
VKQLLCLGAVALAACIVGSAGATAPTAGTLASGNAHMLGAVPSFSHSSRLAAARPRGSGNLTYHGGPVEHTNKTYAIYWVPSGYTIQSGYDTVINRFFGDVAAASGQTSNVYYSTTQYSDSVNGKLLYSSSFGGSYTDTSALPASGCTDSYTSVCLSDAQIQAEIKKDITAAGWTPSPTTQFFLFTAKGIGSCSGTSCAFSNYCAYHGWIGSGSSVTLYANMPYADTVPAACDYGATYHPNGNDADATLNVTSHEHAETITDEQGNAWYDRAGYENGDKCAWYFGTATGSTAYGSYNQTINGNHYWLQQEYSNQTRTCVLQGY